MTGLFLTWLGSSVADSRKDPDGAVWFRFGLPVSDHFREASAKYVKEHNRLHKTSFSISFPKARRMKISEGRRSK